MTVFTRPIESLFDRSPFLAIIRGLSPADSLAMAERAWAAGVLAVEIPLQNDEGEAALRVVAAEGARRGLAVGAGTIISPALVARAAAAGAQFTVAPGTDAAVIDASIGADLPHLPGVATPSNIQLGWARGLRWFKAFPADQLGPGWFPAMRAPYPEARFIATGGVDGTNARSYLDAGVDAVSLGSSLTRPDTLEAVAAILAERRGA